MSSSDNYYRRRIEEELAAAKAADRSEIAVIHRELASRYREMLETRLQLTTSQIELERSAEL